MNGRPVAGFTLIELMIVIAVIAVIAAIAIPNLLEARKRSNETAAIQLMRSIHAGQNIFRERDYDKDGIYDYARTLKQLKGIVDDTLARDGERYGYRFEILAANQYNFRCRATCLAKGRTGDSGYFVDETGVIRICTDNNADETDPPIGG